MAETKQAEAVGRLTDRNVNLATWRRFKSEAAREGRDMGPRLTEVLADWCDYFDQERAEAAKA